VGVVGRLREKLVDVLVSMVKPLVYVIGILSFPLVLLCIASIEVVLRLNKLFRRFLHIKPAEEDLTNVKQEVIKKFMMVVIAITMILVSTILYKLINTPYILTITINVVGLIILFYVMCWAVYILYYVDGIPPLKEN
jgi:hypothetical protein